MRRIISMTAALALVAGTAFAAPAVTNKDAAQNIINISGEAASGDTVSLLIVNPGYGLSDVYTNPSEAQQYVRSGFAADSLYSFDVKMNVPSDGGGKYTAVVNVGGKSENFEFSFYPIEAKLEAIEAINGANSASDLTSVSGGEGQSVLDRVIDVYGLGSFVLTDDVAKNDLASIIVAEAGSGYGSDADAMYNSLKASVYVAALNNSSDSAFEDGYLINPEILGIEETPIYKDYASAVNQDGLKAIQKALSGQDFETLGDMVEAFEDNTVLQLIVNNVKYGNGHVAGILEKYEDILEDAGFELSRLSKISKKSKLYDTLVSSNAKTLAALADDFNDYEDPETGGSGGGGGSGSKIGGSNATVSSNAGSVPGYIPSEADSPVAVVFDDLGSVEWAKESIENLASKGIVNGKGNNKFDPNGIVTRAEFTKMVIGAAGLTNLNAVCGFGDVSDDWAKPYIASAADHGIVNGIDSLNFGPGNPISREQGAVIVYRTLNALGINLEGEAIAFADAAEFAEYAKEAIDKLSAAGIINGKGDNRFAPWEALTRAEAAKIIYTALMAE